MKTRIMHVIINTNDTITITYNTGTVKTMAPREMPGTAVMWLYENNFTVLENLIENTGIDLIANHKNVAKKYFTSLATAYAEMGAEPDFDAWSDDRITAYIVWSCTTHTGKMSGIKSIGTSCLCNKSCITRHNTRDSICANCYSFRLQDLRQELKNKLALNTLFYSTYEIKPEQVPRINAACMRFESFGELNNELQFLNYRLIAAMNSHCIFTLWSKMLFLIDRAFKHNHISKPANMIIIQSSVFTNKADKIKYTFVDKLFTVYSKEYTAANNINITCGARDCLACMKCYSINNTVYLNELEK